MRIFVSYRRSDTQDFAGRLADRLREAPGVRDVFLDVEGIDPGEDFQTKLSAALAKSDVCLVLIGRTWLGVRADGQGARIDDPADFVRLEVNIALRGQGRIVPVLANGALMPDPADLPEDLRAIVKLNAISVRHADFDRDVDHLLDVMFSRKKPGRLESYWNNHPLQAGVMRGVTGAVLAAIGLFVAAAIHFSVTGQSLDQAIGGAGPTIVLIGVVVAAGAAAPNIARWSRRRRTASR